MLFFFFCKMSWKMEMRLPRWLFHHLRVASKNILKYKTDVFKTKWSSLIHQYIQTWKFMLRPLVRLSSLPKWNLNYCPKVKCKTRVPKVNALIATYAAKTFEFETINQNWRPCSLCHITHLIIIMKPLAAMTNFCGRLVLWFWEDYQSLIELMT